MFDLAVLINIILSHEYVYLIVAIGQRTGSDWVTVVKIVPPTGIIMYVHLTNER